MHSVPLMMDVFSNNKNAYHERKMRNNNKPKQWCLIIYIYIKVIPPICIKYDYIGIDYNITI